MPPNLKRKIKERDYDDGELSSKKYRKTKKIDKMSDDSGYEASNEDPMIKKKQKKQEEPQPFFSYNNMNLEEKNMQTENAEQTLTIIEPQSPEKVYGNPQKTKTINSGYQQEINLENSGYQQEINLENSGYQQEINLKKKDYSYRPSNAENNYSIHNWIPILIMAGLIMAAAVFVIVKYFYSAAFKDSKEKEETKKMKASYSEAQIIIEKNHTEPSSSFSTIESNFNGRRAKSSHSMKEPVKIYDTRQARSTISMTSVRPVKNESINANQSFDSLFSTTDIYESPQEKKCLTENKFCPNDVIEILTPFYTDTASCRPLVEGMLLHVINVDDNGDLKVRHSSWSSNSWIFKNNYSKIQKI